jgi:hypothetical protein
VWLGDGAAGDLGDAWAFIEAAPAGGGESLTNPCDKWFCNPSHFNGSTEVFATAFARGETDASYPMEWEQANKGVPGFDRSKLYTAACGKC